jgi:hypothetical protein
VEVEEPAVAAEVVAEAGVVAEAVGAEEEEAVPAAGVAERPRST